MLVRTPRRSPLLLAARQSGAGRFLGTRLWPGLTVPGLAALLSALAFWFGAPAPAPEIQPQLTAGNQSLPLPELRPAPQPGPGAPLSAAPPPELPRFLSVPPGGAVPVRGWHGPTFAPELAVLGRWQLEG